MKTISLPTEQFQLLQVLINKDNFYAEEGFSDVATSDVHNMTSKLGMANDVSKKALRSLISKGILHTDTFEHNEINDKGRWAKARYTIVYLTEQLWHLVDWNKNCYGQCNDEDVIFTDNGTPMKSSTQPTGERGQLTPMGQGEFTVNNALGRESAIIEALKVTDMKNAKTAMNKFIKSNRTTARYYGVTLVKK